MIRIASSRRAKARGIAAAREEIRKRELTMVMRGMGSVHRITGIERVWSCPLSVPRCPRAGGTDNGQQTTENEMAEERYEPVSCDYHDLLEEAAMHKKQIELEFDLDGVTQREMGTIADVYS